MADARRQMTIEGDDPSRSGCDAATFEDMRQFLVACWEYERQMHSTNLHGGDRVLARRRELVDSATQMMIDDEFHNGKPWVDLSEEDQMQGLKSLLVLICSRRVMRICETRYNVSLGWMRACW